MLRETAITLEVLTKTRIGLTVNGLRKSSKDEEVITLSKTIIKHWKKLLDAKNDKVSENGSAVKEEKPSPGNGSAGKAATPQEVTPSPQDRKKASVGKSPASRTSSTTAPSDTGNEVRLKCREMLSMALKVDFSMEAGETAADLADADEMAAKIEDAIYKELKNTDAKYKNRIRSRVANLRDVKNPDLRSNVLRGAIQPEKIASMNAEEMASAEMKQLRHRFTKESIEDHQMTFTSGTATDLIKCPACKKSNTTYNQVSVWLNVHFSLLFLFHHSNPFRLPSKVQTRSADEPMTTFCFCNECGKRWKFC